MSDIFVHVVLNLQRLQKLRKILKLTGRVSIAQKRAKKQSENKPRNICSRTFIITLPWHPIPSDAII